MLDRPASSVGARSGVQRPISARRAAMAATPSSTSPDERRLDHLLLRGEPARRRRERDARLGRDEPVRQPVGPDARDDGERAVDDARLVRSAVAGTGTNVPATARYESRVTSNLVQTRMATAAEPAFHDVLEEVWGRRWGAHDETGVLRSVLVRPPSRGLARSGPTRGTRRRRRSSTPTAAGTGPTGARRTSTGWPSSTAASCTRSSTRASTWSSRRRWTTRSRRPSTSAIQLVTVPGGAIVGRMAVLMRRGEEADLSRVVAGAGMPVLGTMTGTATLEGGSFVKLRDGVAALTSIRCNDEAADALRDVLRGSGGAVVVPLPGYTIHLDMHLAMLDVDLALADVGGLPYTFLTRLGAMGIDLVHAEPELGANLLALGPRRVLMAEGSPVTGRLRDAGVEVRTVAYDESIATAAACTARRWSGPRPGSGERGDLCHDARVDQLVVGALLLFLTVDDPELSEEFLSGVREAVVTVR